jgi:hypothetical protein
MLLTGCATIVGGGTSQAVNISSEPSGASFVIKSSSGLQMGSGKTPQTLRLPRKNEYQVEFSMDNYRTQSVVLTKGLNGWVWGNFVFGWIVGFIVDFASGSASKLEPAVIQVSLETALLDDGTQKVFGVVRLFNEKGKLINEGKAEMQPENTEAALTATVQAAE